MQWPSLIIDVDCEFSCISFLVRISLLMTNFFFALKSFWLFSLTAHSYHANQVNTKQKLKFSLTILSEPLKINGCAYRSIAFKKLTCFQIGHQSGIWLVDKLLIKNIQIFWINNRNLLNKSVFWVALDKLFPNFLLKTYCKLKNLIKKSHLFKLFWCPLLILKH